VVTYISPSNELKVILPVLLAETGNPVVDGDKVAVGVEVRLLNAKISTLGKF
jgi:hypothetical protein